MNNYGYNSLNTRINHIWNTLVKRSVGLSRASSARLLKKERFNGCHSVSSMLQTVSQRVSFSPCCLPLWIIPARLHVNWFIFAVTNLKGPCFILATSNWFKWVIIWMYFWHNDYDNHCWKMTSHGDKVLAEVQEHTSITPHPPVTSSVFLSLCLSLSYRGLPARELPLIPHAAFITSQLLNTYSVVWHYSTTCMTRHTSLTKELYKVESWKYCNILKFRKCSGLCLRKIYYKDNLACLHDIRKLDS